MNLRDQIAAAGDCERERVEVPQWADADGNPAVIYIRALTADEIDAWESETFQHNGQAVEINRKAIRSRLLCRCIVDEAGQRVFSDKDAGILGSKNTAVINRLYEVAQRLNAKSKADIEELAKNSVAASGESSS